MMLAAAMAATVLVCLSPSSVLTVPAWQENTSVVVIMILIIIVIIIIIIVIIIVIIIAIVIVIVIVIIITIIIIIIMIMIMRTGLLYSASPAHEHRMECCTPHTPVLSSQDV